MLKWVIKRYIAGKLRATITRMPLAAIARWANYVSANADRLAQAAGDGDITDDEVDSLIDSLLTMPSADE